MTDSFIHDAHAARVVFGSGRRDRAPEELQQLGRHALLIFDPVAARVAPELTAELETRACAVLDSARQHVPAADAAAARELSQRRGADCLVAFGGGSAIGLAKAVALTERLPILAVPTTYAGSEMTPVWGITEACHKVTGRDAAVAPRTVIYDPELTYGLPASMTAVSGLNAMAHCVDALWAPSRTPLTDAIAERGIRLLQAALPRAVHDGLDTDARTEALAGAWLAGCTFAVAGSGLHHKVCHLLGGRFDLPHAETHAAVLPAVVEIMCEHAPAAAAALGRALGTDDPAGRIGSLVTELGAPLSLRSIGLDKVPAELAGEIDLAGLAVPDSLDHAAVHAMLIQAFT